MISRAIHLCRFLIVLLAMACGSNPTPPDATVEDKGNPAPLIKYAVVEMANDHAQVSIEVGAFDLSATAEVTATVSGLNLVLSAESGAEVHVAMDTSVDAQDRRTVNLVVTREGEGIGLTQVFTPEAEPQAALLFLPSSSGSAESGALPEALYIQEFKDSETVATQVEEWLLEYYKASWALDPLFHLAFVVGQDPRFLEALQGAAHSEPGTDGDSSTAERRDAVHLSDKCQRVLPNTVACGICFPVATLVNALESLLSDTLVKIEPSDLIPKRVSSAETLVGIVKFLAKSVILRVFQLPSCAFCFADQWQRLDRCARGAAGEITLKDCAGACGHKPQNGRDTHDVGVTKDRHYCSCTCSPKKCGAYRPTRDSTVCFTTCENGLCIAKQCRDDQDCSERQCVPKECDTSCGDEICPESKCPDDFACINHGCQLKPAVQPDPSEKPPAEPTAPNPNATASTHSASSTGDPHLRTFDGLTFDVQAPGEFVLLELVDEPAGVRVQARTQRLATDICPHVAWNGAIAAAVGESRVAFYADRRDTLWVDGSAVSLAVAESADLGGAATIERSAANEWSLRLGDGGILHVRKVALADTHHLDLTLTASTLWQGRSRGLLGNFDGDAANDLTLRDGTTLSQPLPWASLYQSLIASYRIAADESLFDYGAAESPATFAVFDIPTAPALASLLPPALVNGARAICEATGVTDTGLLEACIVDVVCSGGDAGQADWISTAEPGSATVEVNYSGYELGATENTAAESCEHLQAGGGSPQSGSYWIKSGDTATLTYCEMTLAGGGWTLLVDGVAGSLDRNAIKTYLYGYGDRWYRSPSTTLNWEWTSGKELLGEYAYYDGVTTSALSCTGSDEKPQFGVGCSNGPGNLPKVLPIYNSNPSAGQCTVCQDSSHAFGNIACQPNVSVFVR